MIHLCIQYSCSWILMQQQLIWYLLCLWDRRYFFPKGNKARSIKFLISKKQKMKSVKKSITALLAMGMIMTGCQKTVAPERINNSTINDKSTIANTYTMPDEGKPHEGTWLQWPHQYTYGFQYRNRLDQTWVDMTRELIKSENVHIIAYNNAEKNRIITKLQNAGISLTKIDFKIMQTNDCWVRDNGPVFVRNSSGQLRIQDWGFNGWGNKTPFRKDDVIPATVGSAIGIPVVNLNTTMTLEGGAVTIDGNGVFMGTKSSILNSNRNPGLTQLQAEAILSANLGVTKFIWLDGAVSQGDITDCHIDGFATFANANTIVTMDSIDLWYWYLQPADITKLYTANKSNGTPYNIVKLPLTQNDVSTAYGKNLGYKGSYCNYYIANTRVLVPIYNDPNDVVALNILKAVYPGKTVVGIDCRNLYEQGGMVHCVTQQQPAP